MPPKRKTHQIERRRALIDQYASSGLRRLRLPAIGHFDLPRKLNLEVHDLTDGALFHEVFGQPHLAQIAKLGSQLEARAGGVRRADHLFGQPEVRGGRHFA